MTDRRKNPARNRNFSIEYLVMVDDDGRGWSITRDGQRTGGFAAEKTTAIGLAYREASREMAETGAPVSVWSVQGGKRTKEWPG